MKTKILLSLAGLMMMMFAACLPEEEDTDPNDPVAKFIGTWKVNETCNRMNYNVEILQDPGNSAQVLLYNFGNPGAGSDPAVGLVVSNTIYIAAQTIDVDWNVEGEGRYQTDGTISWDYKLGIGPDNYDCSAVFSR